MLMRGLNNLKRNNMTTPVKFELAKLLKEKEFNNSCSHYYFEDGVFVQHSLKGTNGYYGDQYEHELEEFNENWNNKWLTKKNGDRCFGCSKSNGYFETFSAPTIAEVVMWLYEKHGIWISVDMDDIKEFYSTVNGFETCFGKINPTEAYEIAIEYCLTKLI